MVLNMTRYTWIVGIYVEVKQCDKCPFYSTEYELSAECRYPHNPAKESIGEDLPYYLGDYLGVAPDCPLREKD